MKFRFLPLLASIAALLCACGPSSVRETTEPQPSLPATAAESQASLSTTAATEPDVSSEPQSQLELFAANRSQWLSVINTEVSAPVFFAVTDLDQNGRLEILASFCQGTGHFSTNHLWEADPETQTLAEARMSLPEGDSQADLSFQNTAQCYYDAAAGQYHYIFSDTLKIGAPEYHYSVRALTLYQGDLSDQVLAQKTELYTDDGSAEITCADAQGNPISQEAYDSAAADRFSGLSSVTVTLGWISSNDQDLSALSQNELTQLLEQSFEAFTASWE